MVDLLLYALWHRLTATSTIPLLFDVSLGHFSPAFLFVFSTADTVASCRSLPVILFACSDNWKFLLPVFAFLGRWASLYLFTSLCGCSVFYCCRIIAGGKRPFARLVLLAVTIIYAVRSPLPPLTALLLYCCRDHLGLIRIVLIRRSRVGNSS